MCTMAEGQTGWSINIWIDRKKTYCGFVNSLRKCWASIQSLDSFYCNHVHYLKKNRKETISYYLKLVISGLQLEKKYFVVLSEQLCYIQMRNIWFSGCVHAHHLPPP